MTPLSQPVINILLAQNPHDFDCVVNDAVIDTVDTADTAPVPLADVINGLVLVSPFREFFEVLEKRIEVSIGLLCAELKNATSINTLQIALRFFVNLIIHHCAATLL